MNTLSVELGERSYPIYIGEDLIDRPDLYKQHLTGQQILVVTNETVAPLYLARVRNALSGWEVTEIVLRDGEQYKNIDTWEEIINQLMSSGFRRDCTLIALGGGVVGDLTGFAASCFQRGVGFIQVPTTLLAQVDSSVGGKTGVNHALGKNMIGAFYQPKCVIADIGTLDTLDNRQLSAGLAEVIKSGLICDEAFFQWIESWLDSLIKRDHKALGEAIEWSCRIKARIVADDEKETGQRALLNLGHTFGHAIETGMGYGQWLHGEAVGVGIRMAADFSKRMGMINEADLLRIIEVLRRAGLPVSRPNCIGKEEFSRLMARDKKAVAEGVRLVLLQGIGKALLTGTYDQKLLESTIENC